MPVKNFLSQEQKQSLQQALRESEQPELRERVLMLLLMNEGKTYEQIASFIGCSQRKVAKRVRTWRPRQDRKLTR